MHVDELGDEAVVEGGPGAQREEEDGVEGLDAGVGEHAEQAVDGGVVVVGDGVEEDARALAVLARVPGYERQEDVALEVLAGAVRAHDPLVQTLGQAILDGAAAAAAAAAAAVAVRSVCARGHAAYEELVLDVDVVAGGAHHVQHGRVHAALGVGEAGGPAAHAAQRLDAASGRQRCVMTFK